MYGWYDTKLDISHDSINLSLPPLPFSVSVYQLLSPTDVVFTRDKGAMVALTGAAAGGPRDSVINPDFDFGTYYK